MALVIAVNAKEAMGKDAVAQEGADLLLGEAGNDRVFRARGGEEGLELLADHAMKVRLFGRPRSVAGRGCARGRRGRRSRAPVR